MASVQQALERHIKQKEVISFSYSKKGNRYTVEPYKILYSDGFWYLVCLHEGIVKKYVLDFVEGMRTTGRYYQEIPENIRKTLQDAKTIWFHEKEPDRVTVDVDDGSQDDTIKVVRGFAKSEPALRLIPLPTCMGKGGVVRQGMLAARGRLQLFTDADGATAITELDRLEQAVRNGADERRDCGSLGARHDRSASV